MTSELVFATTETPATPITVQSSARGAGITALTLSFVSGNGGEEFVIRTEEVDIGARIPAAFFQKIKGHDIRRQCERRHAGTQ